MNLIELRVERIRSGFSQKQMADRLEMAEASYNRKETGLREFSCGEIKKVAKVLDLTLQRVNEIFFDNELTKS